MIAPGTILQNRYLVERQIGAGGMGAVYIATDQRFGSTVALKETFFDDANLRKAFEREAKLLNRLRHVALPRVSDHFAEEEGQFLVMEYIPGEDLSDMLKKRATPFPAREVLAWADQLLDALDYLHTQTPPVIHRDIKPQNLKLGERNQIVLLDFGLAKGAPVQTRVSTTGSLFGYSFNYAPIEQMQGTGTDPRSDLYSLGATLFHLLTNTTPPDALTRATAVLNADADPLRFASELNARVPTEVSAVLARSLEQSAARRFSSAQEMRASLRAAAGSLDEETGTDARMATTIASASEQQTRLAQERDGATSPAAPRAGATDAGGAQSEAATLLNTGVNKSEKTGVVTDETAALAAGTTAGLVKDETRPRSQAPREDASVVTRMRVVKDAGARRGSSRRAFGVVAALIVFAIVAAAVYSFTTRREAPAPQPARPAPTPAAAPTQQAETSQTPVAEVRPTPQSTPAAAAQPRHTPAPEAKNEKPQNEGRPAAIITPPKPPAPAEQPESDAQAEAEADAMFHSRDWMRNPPTDEEMRLWAEEHPRRARALARRIREQQRRQRQQQKRNGMRQLPLPPNRRPRPYSELHMSGNGSEPGARASLPANEPIGE